MKTVPIRIAGREFALAFPLNALLAVQETFAEADLANVTDLVRKPDSLLKLLYIMAKEGERLEGRVLDVDRDWLGSRIAPSPASVANLQITVLNTMSEWLKMETEEEDDAERDVVLDDIKKNGEKAG